MQQSKIKIQFPFGGTGIIDGYVVGDGTFAVHKRYLVKGQLEKQWHATHILTGLALPGVFRTRDDAAEMAHRVLDLDDWLSTVRAYYPNNSTLNKRVREISREILDRRVPDEYPG